MPDVVYQVAMVATVYRFDCTPFYQFAILPVCQFNSVYQVADLDAVGQVDRGRREPGSGAGGTFITETQII